MSNLSPSIQSHARLHAMMSSIELQYMLSRVALKASTAVRDCLDFFGFDPVKLWRNIIGIPRFIANRLLLSRQIAQSNNAFNCFPSSRVFGGLYPVLGDFRRSAGSASGHYFHQDLLVANRIYQASPDEHLDIGSRVDGFIAHLLAFNQNLVIGDIRPLDISYGTCSFRHIDLTNSQEVNNVGSYSSVSCLHAVEHMGLGRYGDPVDFMGHIKAIRNLSNLLVSGGTLYISFPTSNPGRILYNAHRLISLHESRLIFRECNLHIVDLHYVDDKGSLCGPFVEDEVDFANNYNLSYGCSIWTLLKG